REHAEILEEHVNVRTVSYGTRRSRSVHVLQSPLARARHFPLPQDLSGISIETNHVQLVFVVRGDKHAVAREHWRRMARRQHRFPDHVLDWTKSLRQIGRGRNSGAVWAAKLRPLFTGNKCGENKGK